MSIDTDTDEEYCPACEGNQDEHEPDVCGWVNDDCPEGCNTEHSVDRGYVVECPQTWRSWRYCVLCGWELVYDRYPEDPTYVPGVGLLCDPYEHDFSYCGMCCEWSSRENMHYDEDAGEDYCSDCYTPRGNNPGLAQRRCPECESTDRHLNLLTEAYLCDCAALAHHARGVPVEWASGTPAYNFVLNLGRVA